MDGGSVGLLVALEAAMHTVTRAQIVAVATLTTVVLFAGVVLAATLGNFSA